MFQLYNFCWLLLAQVPEKAAGAANAPGGPAAEEPPGFFDTLGPMFWAMMVVMMLYFVLMPRPKAAGAGKTSDLLAKLKKNDRVVTTGGILGTVVNFKTDDEYVTLRVDDNSNTRMQVLATSIVRVVSDSDSKT